MIVRTMKTVENIKNCCGTFLKVFRGDDDIRSPVLLFLVMVVNQILKPATPPHRTI